ncbi:CPBP family intramembrane glutamic endopeptidase [Roseimaritima ulvae]|uniref:CAAX amino terminal protease self-immunity n=1 Tax=Roseimaritima ulvae TaxID=980254 RepID=A0A5B9QMY5_9BACT|nr:CPBP family intramembrane glutamic endopeptidase [Roseimaritima ulvae]QEG38376.1 CAAX amino terminal protease self- immunity [Roseimaritima ulvae]
MDDPDDFPWNSNDEPQSDPGSFFLKAAGFELLLGLIGLAAAWMLGYDARQLIPRGDQYGDIFYGLGVGVVATAPMLLAVWILERLNLTGVEELSRITKDRLLAPMRHLTVLELFAISVCAGLGEELLFRGWLQGWLIGPLDEASQVQIIVGVAVASLAFGLVHAMTPTYFALATLVGVYLGYLTILTENLLVPIVAHALYDAVQLIFAFRDD